MLQKIRDKAQGVLSWVILLLICVPFALWGIQNYLDVGKETPVATVGEKEFFQRDVNRAYNQFSEQYAGKGFSEENLKQQALKKLISDEVLLQYVRDQGLSVTDDTVRSYISSLPYFQVDDKFSKQRYQELLSAQKLSPAEFAARIRNALIMGQFQNTIVNSSFATGYEVEQFFKIQNQQRAVEYVSIAVPENNELPADQEIQDFYDEHQAQFQSPEQVSIEYITLSLEDLAEQVEPDEQQLQDFYEDQQEVYTTKERRKISHILFKFSDAPDQDDVVLKRAQAVKERLKNEDFAVVAAEVSEDKLTAKKGGDLGLFTEGDMEPAFEEAVLALQKDGISEPVKSAFGYHIIKVTELEPERTKTFEEAKKDVTAAYKKSIAENTFFELGETLTEVSYENPDNLSAVADAVGLEVNTTELFSQGQGEGLTAEPAVQSAAFSEDVLKGNNSEPIELGADKVVVLRMLQYEPAAALPLDEVKDTIIAALRKQKANAQAQQQADSIKQAVLDGQSLQQLAETKQLKFESFEKLNRNNGQVPYQLNQAIFKAAKPVDGKATVELVLMPTGERVVFNLTQVIPGEITEQEKQQLDLANANIARVIGQSTFAALLADLESDTDVEIRN